MGDVFLEYIALEHLPETVQAIRQQGPAVHCNLRGGQRTFWEPW